VRSAIFAALFDALAETGVQSGLTQLERATEVAVTILVATEAILITVVVVVAIPTISVAACMIFGVISVLERFTEVATVEFRPFWLICVLLHIQILARIVSSVPTGRQLCGQIIVQDGHHSLTISYDEFTAGRTGVTRNGPRIVIAAPLRYIGGPVINTINDYRLS
jgi:hypothetical protein